MYDYDYFTKRMGYVIDEMCIRDRYAMAHLHDNKSYETAGWSAYARSVADAMVGYNLSRYFSILNAPAFLPVGRVQTATMGLVCQRDLLIEGHHKVTYYEAVSYTHLIVRLHGYIRITISGISASGETGDLNWLWQTPFF